MCLILLALEQHTEYPLIIAANRDELYQRPTSPLHFWDDDPTILAGRDQEQGGTWFGINKTGRIAAVTNTRAVTKTAEPVSRGNLVKEFLQSPVSVDNYLNQTIDNINNYQGFNLLLGEHNSFYLIGTGTTEVIKLKPGYHAISNSSLNNKWPKEKKGKQLLANIISAHSETIAEPLFQLMQDHNSDDEIDASIFIRGETYGTRSTSVLLKDRAGMMTMQENNYDAEANITGTISFEVSGKN